MMRAGCRAFAVSFLFIACAAHGQVYKCAGADGKVAYQSEPCEGGKALIDAPQKAPPVSGSGVGEAGVALDQGSKCNGLSKLIEDAQYYGPKDRTSDDNRRIANFRRICQPLGYRYPDSAASVEHNRALTEDLMRDYVEKVQAPRRAQ